MQRRDFLRAAASALTAAGTMPGRAAADTPKKSGGPQLKLSSNRRYLVDADGKSFFLLGDTPWFLQKLRRDDLKLVLDDRKKKGFNTLFLELLDDSRIPSVDGYGNVAFDPVTDITRPVEAYWKYAEEVLREADRRGFYVILSELWYGYGDGLWLHHVSPESAKTYGALIGKRFARFRNLMWMHAGDHNPDERLAECTRVLAQQIKAAAPHQLHTVHNAPGFASAAFYHDDDWLDVNLGYTYGASYLQILPEYRREKPIRPIILGETGYEDEPNGIQLLPDARPGELWTPLRIRRNAWWAVTCGAVGYCAGSRLWRWEKNWKEALDVRSTQEAPHILRLMGLIDWWKLIPDEKHEFLTAGYGQWKKADYATAALASDGTCGLVYLPTPRTVTLDLGRLKAKSPARWFDPTTGKLTSAVDGTVDNQGARTFQPPDRNAAGETDWVLLVGPAG